MDEVKETESVERTEPQVGLRELLEHLAVLLAQRYVAQLAAQPEQLSEGTLGSGR